jgi:hypothetical protein
LVDARKTTALGIDGRPAVFIALESGFSPLGERDERPFVRGFGCGGRSAFSGAGCFRAFSPSIEDFGRPPQLVASSSSIPLNKFFVTLFASLFFK